MTAVSLKMLVSATAAAAALSVGVPTALAVQAGDYFTTSGLNGTHSYLTRYSISSTSNGGGILFVRSQSSISGSSGLIQIGYHRSTLSGDDCALNNGNVNIFVEWFTAGGSPSCLTYSSTNSSDKFGVVKSSTSNYWGAYQNGNLVGANHLVGYNTGYALAGGERHGNFVTVSGCWGCNGGAAWQYTTNGGASYTTIGSNATKFNEDGTWFVQLPPSPFQVHD